MSTRLSLRAALAPTIAVTAALSLSACGLGAEEPAEEETTTEEGGGGDSASSGDGELSGEIDFQTWALRNETFQGYFEELIADFEAEHEGVTINWVDQPGEGYQEQLLQQVQTDDLPDVVNLPPDFAYQLQQADALMDLDAADADALEVYTEGGLGAYQYDGAEGTYGYPWYLGTDLSWWNTDLMEAGGVNEIPEDFEGMVEAAMTMAEGDGVPLFSSAPEIGDLAAQGIPILEDGEFVFNTQEAADVLQQYVDIYQGGAMPTEALNNDYEGNVELFFQESVAFTTSSSNFPVDLQDSAPNLVDVTEPTSRIGAPPLFVQGVSVSSQTENEELALAFAQYVTNNENQVEFVKLAPGFLPGTTEGNENPEEFSEAADSDLVANAIELAAEQMPEAEVHLPVQWSEAMETYADQQIPLALRGDITPQEALDRIVEEANSLL